MQIIRSTSASPTFNLATEEYLFSKRQEEFLFFYVNSPSVIVGCNQAIANEVNFPFCAENNIQIVRRMSGGGTVYHDSGNLNYCFITNQDNGKSALNPDFLDPIVKVLHDISIPVEIGKRKDLWLPNAFKISGTASHVSRLRELHHGTLLYDSNLDFLENALEAKNIDINKKAIRSVKSRVKNLRTYLADQGEYTLDAKDFFELIIQKVSDFYKNEKIIFLSEIEKEMIEAIEEKYKTKEWTYKK